MFCSFELYKIDSETSRRRVGFTMLPGTDIVNEKKIHYTNKNTWYRGG